LAALATVGAVARVMLPMAAIAAMAIWLLLNLKVIGTAPEGL
jgi:hypothetical protein